MRKYIILLLAVVVGMSSCQKYRAKLRKKKWIKHAFETLISDDYPNIYAIAWWNENFDNSLLRIDASKKSLKAYRKGVSDDKFITVPSFENGKLASTEGKIYHAAYPDFGGTEDIVSTTAIRDFEALAEKKIVWAYFSNNWYDNIQFPAAAVHTIHLAGKIPFIRMMPRSNFDQGVADPVYSMQKIIDGDFDAELTQWAIDAKNTPYPLLVEFGTEVNGNWFPWNGAFNGGATMNGYGDPNRADGPERFVDAYKHIIDICNNQGVDNITWFFHVDGYGEPAEDWNKIANYYPGDDYIDWIGISIYGPQERGEDYQEFGEVLADVYPQLIALSSKPIAVLEFAITE